MYTYRFAHDSLPLLQVLLPPAKNDLGSTWWFNCPQCLGSHHKLGTALWPGLAGTDFYSRPWVASGSNFLFCMWAVTDQCDHIMNNLTWHMQYTIQWINTIQCIIRIQWINNAQYWNDDVWKVDLYNDSIITEIHLPLALYLCSR